VHHVVGDLDSVAPDLVDDAAAAGATVHRYPADKDATDGELALDLAVELVARGPHDPDGPRHRPHLVVVGGGGGRLDHLVADLASLCGPRLDGLEVSGRFGAASVEVVRPGRPRPVGGDEGEYVSLVVLQGTVRGVTTDGLRWPLVDAVLGPGTTRGVSNEVADPSASVTIDDGVLLVIRPGEAAGPVTPRTTAYDPSPGRA
jgi:thiamine pyrophosphokinase